MYFKVILLLAGLWIVQSEFSTQFGSMVFHLTRRHPNDYDSYGCWCGQTTANISSNITVDDIDNCCKMQAECYMGIRVFNESCQMNGKYHAVYYDDRVQCLDNEGTSNYNLCLCDKRAAECFKQSSSVFNPDYKNASGSNVCQAQTTTTPSSFTMFSLSQIVDGKAVTCSAVNNENPAYTECSNLKQDGLYFPNGIGCGPAWNSTNSKFSDSIGFCRRLTGSKTATISAYYLCDGTRTRTVWTNSTWSTFQDNGYTQHLRCYY